MSTRVAPWRIVSAVLAAVALLGCWSVVHNGWWRVSEQIRDTVVYESYGDAMAAGQVPYRDFDLEYPPGALPAFLAPEATVSRGDTVAYSQAFDRWMSALAVATVLLVAAALAILEASPLRTAAGLVLVAASPVLLGSVVWSRFDEWPSTLSVAALVAILAERERLGAVFLGAAFAAKLYPLVLAPVGLVWVWRRRGRRAAAIWAVVLAVTAAAVFLPFVILAPGGLEHSISVQLSRPLQIESLGAAALLALHQLVDLSLGVVTSHGSQNLGGAGGTLVAALTTVAELLALGATWYAYGRGPATRERLVLGAAAAVAAFVAFGKVFSPQFLVWLVPLVAIARSRTAAVLLAGAMLLTQVWYPSRYPELTAELAPLESWAVVARDLVVVGLFAVLLAALVRQREEEAEA